MIQGSAFAPQKAAALSRVGNGANWFLWIAGMSLINAVAAVFGAKMHFILGLGLTEVIDSIPTSTSGHVIALVCDLMVAGVWVLFNAQAKRGKKWAFITGMVLYLLDALLLLLVKDYLSVAFHAYALFRIFPGLQAVGDFQRIEQAERQQAAMTAAQTGYAPAPGGVWPPPPGTPAPYGNPEPPVVEKRY